MTEKERLEQLKAHQNILQISRISGFVSIYKDDFDWLMKLAELKQEYLEALKFYMEENSHMQAKVIKLQIQIGRENNG
jgi:predicted RNA-binding protein with RPS1 domain